MAMSFKYKAIKRPNGELVKLPLIPVAITGKSSIKVEVGALIDSGADISIVPKDIAEFLVINLDGEKDRYKGIGGEVDVINTILQINIQKGHESYDFQIPAQVILTDEKIPFLLGRTKFFDEFQILFDQPN